MHKPIRMLRPAPVELSGSMRVNVDAALATALLLLPARFDDATLLGTICNLSYAGDVRMGIGESHRKPANIARGQLAELTKLYARPLQQIHGVTAGLGDHAVAGAPASRLQDDTLPARCRLLTSLPSHLQAGLLTELGVPSSTTPRVPDAAFHTRKSGGACTSGQLEAAAQRLWSRSASAEAANARLATAVGRSLQRIVRRASLVQTAKGVLTAGVGTSLAYAAVKMRGAHRAT
jgi:translocator assembly and maintenance protein 41